ncbi:MAG TPA: MBOAT family O-acyltransferase [Bacteroidales bacterium]|nr:MBOAT family O-acyltransferase [Bacteroidales bacterium]
MTFNSLPFLIFLPIVVITYYLIAPRWRWIMLLAASYLFYMWWNPAYIILILFSTLINFYSSHAIERHSSKQQKKKYLYLCLITNLGILFIFKYYGLFTQAFMGIADIFGVKARLPFLNLLLPVGISFYTFQTLSYTLNVYFGKQKAEKHLGYFALFVTFFPQLVAGPIERYDRLAPQLKTPHSPSYENFSNGFRLIIFGLFIKMVIADNLAPYVEEIYSQPAAYNTFHLMAGLGFYSFQIYADFYGYSTIAIGSALLIGVNLMDNFKTPYLSASIREFWRRWHISLSTWFRDYVYIPLGGNRVKWSRWAVNIFIVYTLSGLWHGANWTFLIWGSIFGLMFIIERFFYEHFGIISTEKWGIRRIFGVLITFVIVTLAWIFFRSSSLSNALSMFEALLNNTALADPWRPDPFIMFWLVLFIILDILLFNNRFDQWCSKKPLWLRWTIYTLLIFGITAFSGIDNQPFIYFQF